MDVEFRLLGPVEADIDRRPVLLGHARQRCVLAALLVEANRPVSLDRMVDRVWGERAPQRVRSTLYGYLSRLRHLLASSDLVSIVHQPDGYLLAVDPMSVDMHRFRCLIADARAAEGADAASLFELALGLWRGEAFAGLDTAWLNSVRHAMDAERLAAELDRNDLALTRGEHPERLSELATRAAVYPLDERLVGQLLVALYRCGRQADALGRYEQLRRQLADELGTDPGPPLRLLHRQMLTADPALVGPVRAERVALSTRPAVPQQLPAPPPSFVGRNHQLAELSSAMDASPARGGTMVISAIGGTGGIGKTWLALRWAHENLRRFPDGQLYVNLRGFDPAGEPVSPEIAVRGFLETLGAPAASVRPDLDAQAALYRSLTAGKRMLVILDNARETSQVVPLLPGSTTCTVLVTSRHTLPGLVTAHGARPLVLDALTETEAEQLLTRQLGVERVKAEPTSVAELIDHCAGLPLALGIIAARATIHPELTLAVLAKELRDASTRLDALDAGELAVNLRVVLSYSSGSLGGDAAQVFALLGLASGPDISLPAVASLTCLPTARARALLRELTDAHLVHGSVPGRYRMHDLVRLYAGEQASERETPDRCREALHRLLDHYLHTAQAADRALNPHRESLDLPRIQPNVVCEDFADHRAALDWFVAERLVLMAVVDRAAGAGFERHAWLLARALTTYFDRHGHWADQAVAQRTALAAARHLADLPAQANAHRGLGLAYTWLRRDHEAQVHLRQALELFIELGDRTGQAHAHRSLARLLTQQGRHRDALPHDERAHELHQAAGDRLGQATTLNAIGWHRTHLGDHRQALADCQQALTLYQETGDRSGQAATWDSLGYARRQLGDHQRAITCYQHALELFQELGYRYFEGSTLAAIGDTHHAAGDPTAARRAWQHAVTILDDLGHCNADRVRAKLPPIEVPVRRP